MTAITLAVGTDRPTTSATPAAAVTDTRPIHLAWGSAWAVGCGAMALDGGATPVLDLPALVAPGLLALACWAPPRSPASRRSGTSAARPGRPRWPAPWSAPPG